MTEQRVENAFDIAAFHDGVLVDRAVG